MLSSLRPKYRPLFLSTEEYHDQGLVLSDDLLHLIEQDATLPRLPPLPTPSLIPDYEIGDKLGEGLTSRTFSFLSHLTPFPLVVQYHPISIEATYHLAYISSLLSQLYALCPHLILYLGYYLAPAVEIDSEDKSSHHSNDTHYLYPLSSYEISSSEDRVYSNDYRLELTYDCYAFLYEQVPETLEQVYNSLKRDPQLARCALAQLFFIVELLRRFGFNHGDITLDNIGWVKEPTWQGRDLLLFTSYAYIIETKTYYLTSGPLIRLLDFNLSTYEDNVLHLTPESKYHDDYNAVLLLAKELLSREDYLKIKEEPLGWISLFSQVLPQPGDKVIILGHLPDL